MDGAPVMPDRQIATRDLREHSRNGETVSNSEFVNSLLVHITCGEDSIRNGIYG